MPFTGGERIPNFDFGVNLQTPRLQSFSLTAFVLTGHDESFYEWASGRIIFGTVDLAWRPADRFCAELVYNHQQTDRRDDGSTVAVTRVPQLRLEYQVGRPLFLRLVGEYDDTQVDALRDDGRTGGALLVRDPVTGAFTRTERRVSDRLRLDWLLSYRPTPGTVVFVGYGSTLADAAAFGFRDLSRVTDGFFVKLSYLFRG